MADEERKRADVEREYRDERIAVYWAPQYCIHTANCLNAEPEVFDAMRRPWVILENVSADRIAEAVMTCPTGALSFERFDGGEQEPAPDEVSVTPRPNGPLFLRGKIRVTDLRGDVVREATRVALCRCGGSANKPYCVRSSVSRRKLFVWCVAGAPPNFDHTSKRSDCATARNAFSESGVRAEGFVHAHARNSPGAPSAHTTTDPSRRNRS